MQSCEQAGRQHRCAYEPGCSSTRVNQVGLLVFKFKHDSTKHAGSRQLLCTHTHTHTHTHTPFLSLFVSLSVPVCLSPSHIHAWHASYGTVSPVHRFMLNPMASRSRIPRHASGRAFPDTETACTVDWHAGAHCAAIRVSPKDTR
jgi:hypothetical protein